MKPLFDLRDIGARLEAAPFQNGAARMRLAALG
jgi:hypothetical protein